MANLYNDNKDLKFHLTHPMMQKLVMLKERNFTDKADFDYAPIDFEDAMDSYERVLEVVGEISGDIIAPNAESIDAEGPQVVDGRVIYARGTQENLDALIKAGLLGITLPRRFGGLNFPIVPYIMAADIVSRADAGFVNIWGLQDCAETLNEFASEEQKERWLTRVVQGETMAMDLTEPDAGSDLQAVQLKATWSESKGTWLLNGVKRFITNGDGDIALVLARSEEGTRDGRGLSMYVYDKRKGGVSVRRIEHKMGIIGSPTCELVFKDAPGELIGNRKMGLIKYVMALMNGARLGIAAQAVGISEAAYREALQYAKERAQFGKTIIQFPAVYEMLSVMKAKLDGSRTLLYETARFVDLYKTYQHISEERKLTTEERDEMKEYQKLADIFTPLVKGISSEYCNQNAYDAVERIYRDARITSIYEGTTQLQVVAAIRGVTTEGYLKQIRVYEKQELRPELEKYRRVLISLTWDFEEAAEKVINVGDPEFIDFHARRLVEMAGYIIMSYLLVLDANRDQEYARSAQNFNKMAKGEVKARAEFIRASSLEDIGHYKY